MLPLTGEGLPGAVCRRVTGELFEVVKIVLDISENLGNLRDGPTAGALCPKRRSRPLLGCLLVYRT